MHRTGSVANVHARDTAATAGSQDGPTKHKSISTRVHEFETAVYGSFQILQRKHVAHTTRTLLGFFIKFLQIAAFALAAHASYAWNDSTIQPFQRIAELSTIPGYMEWLNASAYVALYYVAVAWVFLFVGLFVWATVSFMRQSWPVLWPLRLLAAMGTMSTTILYIPLFYLLMSGFTCHLPKENHFWQDLGYQCYTQGHLVQTVVVAVVVCVFVTLCSLFTLVYFDSNPLSVDLSAKSHGRADFAFLCIKTALVVLVEVYPHSVGANALAAYSWIGLCVIVAQVYPACDAAVMVYAGCPIAALAGSGIADWRARGIFRTPIGQLKSIYEIELKVRYFIHGGIWGDAIEELPAAMRPKLKVRAVTSSGKADDMSGSQSLSEELDSIDDSEARVLHVRSMMPAEVVKEAEAFVKAGCLRFKHSAMVHIFAARFYDIFCGNTHLQMSHLCRAERRNPSVDVRFLIFQQRKQSEDGTGSKGQMSALNRVAFEKHLADAKKQVNSALRCQVEFWGELAEAMPDVTRCHQLSSAMTSAISTAEGAFYQLLQLNSQSLLVLRLYADFTMYVVNNQEKANMLIADAERIEDQQTKDYHRETGAVVRVMQHSNLDVLADNTAAVTIGGSFNNLGIILSANAYTSKLFGHSRWQLERRNVSMLIPSPLAESHDSFLRNYLETGEGRVVDYTNVVFGLHRSGYIFPMLLCVREQPASDGPPAFVGIMRALSTSDNHIVMTAEFIITAASQASLAVLNVEPAALAAGDAKMSNWVDEWDIMIHELKQPKGATIRVNAITAAAVSSPMVRGNETPIAPTGRESDTWIRGHLQELPLTGAPSIMILHWSRIATDNYTIAKAEQRRRDSMQAHGILSPSSRPDAALVTTVPKASIKSRAGTPRFTGIDAQLPAGHAAVPAGATVRGCPANIRMNVFDDGSPESDAIMPVSDPRGGVTVDSPTQAAPDGAGVSSPLQSAIRINVPRSPQALTSPKRVVMQSRRFQPDVQEDEGGVRAEVVIGVSDDMPLISNASSVDSAKAIGADEENVSGQTPDGKLEMHPNASAFAWDDPSTLHASANGPLSSTPTAADIQKFRSRANSTGPMPGERASQASSRRSVAKRIQDRLRKTLAESNTKLLPGLVWLRAVGIIIILITAVLGISVAAFSSQQFADFGEVFDGSGMAQALLADGITATQQIRYFTICGLVPCSHAEEAARRPILVSAAEEFSTRLRELYQISKSIGYQQDYETRSVPVTQFDVDFSTSELVRSVTLTSLLQSGLTLATAAQKIGTLPLANITRGQRDVEFMIHNAYKNGSIHDAFNATIFTWISNSLTLASSIRSISDSVYFSMVAMVVIMAMLIVLPILVHVDRTRDRYVLPFIQLPAVVPAKLRANAEKRLLQLRASVQEDEEGESSDQSDLDDNVSISVDKESTAGGEADWNALVQADQARSRMRAKDKVRSEGITPGQSSSSSSGSLLQRGYKKSPRSLLMLMAGFILPLLLVFAFFTVIWAETQSALTRMHAYQAFTAISSQRTLEVRELPMLMRALWSTPGSQAQIAGDASLIYGLLASAQYHDQLLTYVGESSTNELISTVSTTDMFGGGFLDSATVHTLDIALYGNACTFIPLPPETSLEACMAFRGGVLTKGLHGALQDMLQYGRTLVSRRAAANVPLNSTNGEGVIVIRDVEYPYSMAAEVNTQELKDFIDYSMYYLIPGLDRYTGYFHTALDAEINQMATFLVGFVTGFLILFAFYQLTMFLPRVVKTNAEIKGERAVMLLVPHTVLTSFAPLQQMVNEMIEAEESQHNRRL